MIKSYLNEINAFQTWLSINHLSTNGIVLWHGLMMVNNTTRWKPHFNAPMTTVQLLTSLSKQKLSTARMELLDHQLIDYQPGSKRFAPIYQMTSVDHMIHNPAPNPHAASKDQFVDTSLDQVGDRFGHNNRNIQRGRERQRERGGNNSQTPTLSARSLAASMEGGA